MKSGVFVMDLQKKLDKHRAYWSGERLDSPLVTIRRRAALLWR